MKLLLFLFLVLGLMGCSTFKAERVDDAKSDEKALTITDEWIQRDTEKVVADIVRQMQSHRGLQRYLRQNYRKEMPKVFVGEVQNLTSEAYFPIQDINDELLNTISSVGRFVLVDEAQRKALLKEITYQNDGMVDPSTIKQVGKQAGADLIIFGNVYMKVAQRKGQKIRQYSVNIRMTDIEKGVEVMRARAKLSKYSKRSRFGL